MVTVLLAVASLALPSGFSEAKPLESPASFVAGKPVRVYCANTYDDWKAFVAEKYSAQVPSAYLKGLTIPGDSTINLSYCAPLLKQLAHPVKYPDYYFADALQTLTHESLHARGSVDEGQTDCDAVHRVPGVATRFFRVKPGQQLRALMKLVWLVRGEGFPAQRTIC